MDKGIGQGRRVLVIDDEDSIRHALNRFLTEQGFAVTLASGFAEGEEALQADAFDLALIDKNLPDGSGLELARLLAERETPPEVLLTTGYPSVTSAIEGLRQGVADYLIKPFNLADIVGRLHRALTLLDLKRHNRQLVQELQEKNEALQRDPLTELYNHAFFQDSLQKEVMRSRRHGLQFGVLFVDVDSFKGVNDAHGHLAGDGVLLELARMLRGSLRQSDLSFRLGEHCIAARYGGDEFALILPETPKKGAAVKAEALRAFIEEHDFTSQGLPPISISIGVSSFPVDGQDPASLVNTADIALYAAKEGGRNRIVSYVPTLVHDGKYQRRGAEAELARIEGLDRLMANRSFDFVYQPIVETSAGSIFGYEALCRPTDGAFSGAEELIAAAEHAGKVATLGRLLREGCLEPLEDLPEPALLFVNIHPLELNDPRLLDLEAKLHHWRERVVLEITETAEIRDYDRTRTLLGKLRDNGFRIALDDLGAGYSGLNCLSLLEPDFIKLGIAMVQGAHTNERSARLLKHLLEFAREEGMKVIAEGIESEEQLHAVSKLGVHLAQGHYFARPAPPFVALTEGTSQSIAASEDADEDERDAR